MKNPRQAESPGVKRLTIIQRSLPGMIRFCALKVYQVSVTGRWNGKGPGWRWLSAIKEQIWGKVALDTKTMPGAFHFQTLAVLIGTVKRELR